MMIALVFSLLNLIIAAGLIYHYLLLLAGRGARVPRVRESSTRQPSRLRYAIAIPAHNESGVIGETVHRLRTLVYPRDHYDVHVVADYCVDDTATIAAAAGAHAHIRNEGPRGRKGYALDWLIRRLLADPRHYDAIVVFDADSQVDREFLIAVSSMMVDGAQVVQGRHVISNPTASLLTALSEADMRLNNRIRNQAKKNLGLSARLMGDAMVFRREVLEQQPWIGAQSLTEDRDYGLHLVTQGIRIVYTPDAVSYGQAAARWKDATPQRLRWYGGAFDLQRRYFPGLWKLAWRGNWDALDKLLELGLPPFSLLALGAALLLLVQLGLAVLVTWPLTLTVVSALSLLMAVLFPFFGLVLTDAPARSYHALLVGPFYILWRVGIGLWVRLRYRNLSWVRTRRTNDG
jgi:cellulose synthase/poly-beta-1,6-N-acetylglucosamine synthase-like glycosyltransferase